jgi:hypothetical protein
MHFQSRNGHFYFVLFRLCGLKVRFWDSGLALNATRLIFGFEVDWLGQVDICDIPLAVSPYSTSKGHLIRILGFLPPHQAALLVFPLRGFPLTTQA